MNISTNLPRVWIGGSLVIQGFGFAALGILSLVSEGEINRMSNTFVIISSAISMLVSATFLVIAFFYWTRPRISAISNPEPSPRLEVYATMLSGVAGDPQGVRPGSR
jgi:hypothetical protein